MYTRGAEMTRRRAIDRNACIVRICECLARQKNKSKFSRICHFAIVANESFELFVGRGDMFSPLFGTRNDVYPRPTRVFSSKYTDDFNCLEKKRGKSLSILRMFCRRFRQSFLGATADRSKLLVVD